MQSFQVPLVLDRSYRYGGLEPARHGGHRDGDDHSHRGVRNHGGADDADEARYAIRSHRLSHGGLQLGNDHEPLLTWKPHDDDHRWDE